ncbi:unnamed protein product [Ectocarpus sp. 12 AP-2014]
MFSVGSASLPEGGMGEVPKQIAADLPDGCLLLNTKVVSMDKIEEDDYDDDEGEEDALLPYSGSFDGSPRVRLTLEDGSELLAHAAVVATEAPVAAELLGEEAALGGGASPSTGRSSTCLYYAIDGPAPVGGPILVLNGEGAKSSGPVNNVVFLEQTAPSYAPACVRSCTRGGDPTAATASSRRRCALTSRSGSTITRGATRGRGACRREGRTWPSGNTSERTACRTPSPRSDHRSGRGGSTGGRSRWTTRYSCAVITERRRPSTER